MLEVRDSREGRAVAAATGQAGARVTLDVPEPSLWSPAAPTLYDLEYVKAAVVCWVPFNGDDGLYQVDWAQRSERQKAPVRGLIPHSPPV